MFHDLTERIRLRLVGFLEQHVGLEASLRYSTWWHVRVGDLDVKNTSAPEFFRQVLDVTQETCQEFTVDPYVERALQKIILKEFLGSKADDSRA